MKLKFTVIYHKLMVENNLSPLEYMISNYVYYLSQHESSIHRAEGFCFASKQTIANEFGISRRQVINIVNSLIKKNFIERNEKGHLITTDLWNKVVLCGVMV